ncbi:hypothetical protein [Bradyrhizobium genosp. SA-3]|uniref:hypothetical protein n=1 Tax=Bradyrhizobium genosp. SA-3 TaxID=508868 RepID=UPI0010289AE4|nr:hypothetical protein [Bradyrhizobium genosp. SA-3]
MVVKNIVIPLEVEYLQKAAKERGISRSKLVRYVMEKVVNDKLVHTILGENDLSNLEPAPRRYRRFRDDLNGTDPSFYAAAPITSNDASESCCSALAPTPVRPESHRARLPKKK